MPKHYSDNLPSSSGFLRSCFVLLVVLLVTHVTVPTAHAQETPATMAPAFFTEAGQARGADFLVTTTNDVVGRDGVVSLREALQAANTNRPVADAPAGQPDGDVIRFHEDLAGAVIYLGDELAIRDDVFIDGSPVDDLSLMVTLDADGAGRIFNANADPSLGEVSSIAVTDLVLRGGNVPDFGGAIYVARGQQLGLERISMIENSAGVSGGALCNDGGRVSFNGATVAGNRALGTPDGESAASARSLLETHPRLRAAVARASSAPSPASSDATVGGGAFYNLNGSLSIGYTRFEDNQAPGGRGGALLNAGGSMTADSTRLVRNVAGRHGGALANALDGNVSLVGVDVRSNEAGADGGGLHTGGTRATVTVSGGAFSENQAGGGGGGVYSAGGFSAVGGTRFHDNLAAGNGPAAGGGALLNDGGTTTLDEVSFVGNAAPGVAASGGALFNRGGRLSLTDGVVTDNRAGRFGGGLSSDSQSALATASIIGLTLDRNEAVFGGGLYVRGGSVTFSDGSINENTAAVGGGVWSSGNVTLDDEYSTGTAVHNNTATSDSLGQGGGGFYNAGGTLSGSGATVKGNTASGGSGGGIYNAGGNISMEGSAISGNRAGRDGGGIVDEDRPDSTNVTLWRVALDDNEAELTGGRGGGLYSRGIGNSVLLHGGSVAGNRAATGGGLYVNGGLTVDSVRVSDNAAVGSDGSGGALYNRGGSVSVIRSTVNANRTTQGSGGAIYHDGAINGGGTLNVDTTRIAGNRAPSGDGGGIEAASGQVVLAGSVLDDNHAGRRGGAMHVRGGAITTVFRSTLSRNTASTGGGLWTSADATVSVYLSTLSGNAAQDGDGGGLFDDGDSGATESGVVLLASTIARNDASGRGGGLRTTPGGRVFLGNTLLAENDAAVAGDDCAGPLISTGYNRIGSVDGCTFSGHTESNVTGGTVRLGPLADNGGPTPTHLPAPDSRILDAGGRHLDNDTTRTDQRGAGRAGAVDIGAVELHRGERPIALGRFTAEVEDDDVLVTWEASADPSNDLAFRLEQRRHQPDGDLRAWQTVALVQQRSAPSDDSDAPLEYQHRLTDLVPGRYDLRLVQVGGLADGVALEAAKTVVVGLDGTAYTLSEAAPNPLRPGQRASLKLVVRAPQHVTVGLYDARGRLVRQLHAGPVGELQTLDFTVATRALASGLYMVRAVGDEFAATRKLVIVR